MNVNPRRQQDGLLGYTVLYFLFGKSILSSPEQMSLFSIPELSLGEGKESTKKMVLFECICSSHTTESITFPQGMMGQGYGASR